VRKQGEEKKKEKKIPRKKKGCPMRLKSCTRSLICRPARGEKDGEKKKGREEIVMTVLHGGGR